MQTMKTIEHMKTVQRKRRGAAPVDVVALFGHDTELQAEF